MNDRSWKVARHRVTLGELLEFLVISSPHFQPIAVQNLTCERVTVCQLFFSLVKGVYGIGNITYVLQTPP